MTKDEALKQALEALQSGDYWKGVEAVNAIKEALAQPEQEVDWEKLYRLEVKKKEALAAKYERDIKPLTKIVPMAQPEQEPVAFYVYKPTLPRGHLGNVSDVDLPWVYDQDPSSGYSARMLVYTTPPKRKPLTVDEVWQNDQLMALNAELGCGMDLLMEVVEAIEAAHGIKE